MNATVRKYLSGTARLFSQPRTVLWCYIALTVTVSLVQFFKSGSVIGGRHYTSINNFIIFKSAFFNLLSGIDLYMLHPELHWDLFKYSPAFALLFAPLSLLPDIAGVIAWNLINALAMWAAIMLVPYLSLRIRVNILWFVLLELITSLQNTQSNGLVAALILLCFDFLARRKPVAAGCSLVLSVFIKLFGIVTCALFFLFENKGRFVIAMVLWTLFFAVLPVLVTEPSHLISLYRSWFTLLANDHSGGLGLSVIGLLHTWFGWDPPKNAVVLTGVVLFCIPYLHFRHFREARFRLLFVASILIWVVIFNHMAESPTFVIAVTGVAIWYFSQPASRWRLAILILVYIFTCLSPTDIFPRAIRNGLVRPYTLKAAFCIVAWIALQAQLIFYRPEATTAGAYS